jgi:DNA-binding MarR family transcriptional regulator
MADVISRCSFEESRDSEIVALIELLFFAYRDFVSDPDAILRTYGFGRAHHRVVHFVGRNPGLSVAQLLEILQITKQSLARVLKDLVEKGYVLQREGEHDRRQRLLFLTDSGEELRQSLMSPQIARIRRALAETDPAAHHHYRTMLFHMINPEHRAAVRDHIEKASLIGAP